MKYLKKLTCENLLSFFIVMCPILDIASFLFRKKFETNYSISTFIRPIIPTIVFIYIFFKQDRKNKFKYVCARVYLCIVWLHSFIYI